jgi:pyruvate dehydrogenase (quinone)
MSDTVGDFVFKRLHDWGVRRIYGFPGDGINGFLGALNRAEGTDHAIRFIQTRHEEEAAFMACAHAKFTGEIGVCLATSGPGAIHLLNGLYDAEKDHMPVLAIVGQQARQGLGSDYQQEVDLVSLYKDLTEYVQLATVPSQARHLVDQSVRIAKGRRSVSTLIFSNDLQEEDYEEPPRTHGSVFSGVGYSAPKVVPEEKDLREAARVLNEGEKVAMLVGAGAKNAVDEVTRAAETLGAGVAKALLAKCMVPDDLPYVTGSIGLLGTEPSADMMLGCDTLLMVGTSFPYSEHLPVGRQDEVNGVQIDIDPSNLGVRFPNEVNLCGDAQATLEALLPMLDRKEDREWQDDIIGKVEEWWRIVEDRAMDDADPINPQRVFWEVNDKLPDNVILTADSGSSANWYARHLKARRGWDGSLSGGLATMCPGVPYATAAKFCHPHRPIVAFAGDGAMQMLGDAGLITIAKYWEEWASPQLIVCVLNNGDLNQVTWEQRVMEGDPKFEASQNIPDIPYDEYAEDLGLRGLRMEEPADIGRVWDEAFAARRPVVINAYTDPEVPPLPPHINLEQAKHFALSLAKGDPNLKGSVRQSIRGMASKYTEKVKSLAGEE